MKNSRRHDGGIKKWKRMEEKCYTEEGSRNVSIHLIGFSEAERK